MKNATELLWKLTHSITEEEKKTIQKILKNDEHDINLTHEQKLFEWFCNSSVANTKAAAKALGNKVSFETFEVVRTNLRNKVINGILITQEDEMFEKKFHKRMLEGYILQAKGLSSEAESVFKKIVVESKSREKYFLHLQSLAAQNWLVTITHGSDAIKISSNLRKEIGETALLINHIYELQAIYFETVQIILRTIILRKQDDVLKVKELLKNSILKKRYSNTHYFVQLYASLSRYNLFIVTGRFEDAYISCRNFYQFIKKRFMEGKAQPIEILNAGFDYSTSCLNAKKYSEALEAVNEYSTFRQQFAPMDKILEGIEIHIKSSYRTSQDNYDINLPEHTRLFEYYHAMTDNEKSNFLTKSLQLLVAEVYSKNNKYALAIEILDNVSSEKITAEIRTDIIEAAKIIRVIFGAESSLSFLRKKILLNDKVFQIRAKQYYELIRKSNDNYILEKRVLRFFFNIKHEQSIVSLINEIEKLQYDIEKMKTQEGNEYIPVMLQFIKFDKWLESFKLQLENHAV